MGKDKKEKNPADAFRKDQRKKELLKLKKDREVVKGVRDLLNDPRKIDEEIAKAQRISDGNKLDKSLKDKIKELQRMKDVANTRQLVLAAQGKKSLTEAESITKPSIYQKNEGLWENPSGNKASSSGHGHIKSASRISTEGLAPYARSDETNLVTQMPLPTSVMMPYPVAGVAPVGIQLQGGRGPIMGGTAGIPLPPPRPLVGAPYNPALQQGYAVPSPPMYSGVPVQMQMGGFAVPPPPGPPPGYPPSGYPPVQYQLQPPAGFPPQMHGYPPMGGMPVVYPYLPQQQFQPQPGYGGPQVPQQQHQPRGPPKQHQQKDRKPRPPRGGTEEVDPLDPAGRGYTERFGAAVPGKKTHSLPHSQGGEVATVQAPPMLPTASTVDELVESSVSVDASGDNVAQTALVEVDVVSPSVPPPAHSALSAEELMRRRHVVHSETGNNTHVDSVESVGPSAGPAGPSVGTFAYPTLSAEELLLRRRHQLPVEEAVQHSDETLDFAPARPPPSYGAVLSAEELMRRRYVVQEEESVDTVPSHSGVEQGPASGGHTYGGNESETSDRRAEELMRRRFEVPTYEVAEDVHSDPEEGPAPGPARVPMTSEQQYNYSSNQPGTQEAVDSEELMRQRFEIPDMEAEDVLSDEEEKEEGREGAYFSEDDVRSAGEPEPIFDDVEEDEEEDPDAEPLELNLRNLYPARLPASFTALPASRIAHALPVAPMSKPPSMYSSAINFNDYGDDDEEEEEEEVYEEPKIQPYASAAPHAPAVLPARAPENFPASSYYPEGVESAEISHAVVKGPKIVKTDRALTAFVPNAIKKKRLHSGGGTSGATLHTFRKPVTAEPVGDHSVEAGDDSAGEEPASKSARQESATVDYTASLHAATSALFRPSATVAYVPVASVPTRAPLAPVSFVPATTSTVSLTKARAPVASAEDDAMALFFSEINQLEGV